MSEPVETEPVDSSAETDDELLLRRRKRHAPELITGLNLTAMMDVMTILLVYLIKVYASAPENITLNDDLRPPPSTAPANIVPSVSVLISKTAIVVDGKPVAKVEGGRVVSEDPKKQYLPVEAALTARRDVIKAINQAGGSEFDGNLMLIADEATPYELIAGVLYTAGKTQYVAYRLVVVHK